MASLRNRKQEETAEVVVETVRGAVVGHHQMILLVASLWKAESWPPKEVHILIPGPCEYITYKAKGILQMVLSKEH